MPRFSINHGKQILHERNAKPVVVGHDVHEYEVEINSQWCDIGSHKVPEWEIRSVGDASVCDGCYDHYNDRW